MMSTKRKFGDDAKTSLITIPLFSIFLCCNVQHSAQTARSGNSNTPVSPSAFVNEQFGDNKLLVQLQTEQKLEKPFAWWSWDGKEKGGTVIGVDHEGQLKRVEFIRTTNGYIFRSSEPNHELNVPIMKSGDLELGKYLPDTEFPFKSFVISAAGCNAHFILAWRALNRSFESRSKDAAYLDSIDLRVIVERDGTVVSNRLERLLFESLDNTLAEDVNNDGKPDFLLVGSSMSTTIRIWTIEESCDVRPLFFKENDHLLESLNGRGGVSVTKNQATGCYDVNRVHREPITKGDRVFFEVTNTIYRWDRKNAVYKPTGTRSRLEPGSN